MYHYYYYYYHAEMCQFNEVYSIIFYGPEQIDTTSEALQMMLDDDNLLDIVSR